MIICPLCEKEIKQNQEAISITRGLLKGSRVEVVHSAYAKYIICKTCFQRITFKSDTLGA